MLVLNILFVSFASSISYVSTIWLPALMPFVAVAVILSQLIDLPVLERPAIKFGKNLAVRTMAGPRIHGT